MSTLITAATVKSALRDARAADQQYDVSDSKIAGLRVRNETANWSVRARLGVKQRRFDLGRVCEGGGDDAGNAGITRPAMIEKMTLQQWQEVIDVHLTGAFYWLQAAGRHMVQRAKAGDKTGGSIVNISSDAGRKGSIGQINYAAAKAGMLGLTMTAAREWGKFNVRTNSICFGVVETPMTEGCVAVRQCFQVTNRFRLRLRRRAVRA